MGEALAEPPFNHSQLGATTQSITQRSAEIAIEPFGTTTERLAGQIQLGAVRPQIKRGRDSISDAPRPADV